MEGKKRKMSKKMSSLTSGLTIAMVALTLQLIGTPAHATPNWDLTGTYKVTSVWNGGSNQSIFEITSMNLQTGAFSGTQSLIGYGPTWEGGLFSGTETGNTFTAESRFASGEWGTFDGSIKDDGSLYMTWGHNGVNGTAWSVEGAATKIPPAVPEPSTVLLFGTGIVGLVGIARRKK